jgi:hypothetical protein
MKSKIICSPESAVLLASYVVQCKFGDYSEEYTSGFIDIVDLLPQRILSQYRMSVEDWEERVIGLWKGRLISSVQIFFQVTKESAANLRWWII